MLGPPRKGQDHTKSFMESKCRLVFPKSQDQTSFGKCFADVASFVSMWANSEGVSRVFLARQFQSTLTTKKAFLNVPPNFSGTLLGEQVIELNNWFVPVLALRFVLCGLDTCVWPSNSVYVANCLATFINVLAMSPNNAGHCQTPVMQSQTTTDAWVKHKRVLEDTLKKGRMDITVPVTLTFDKSSCHANDKRCVNHPCLFVSAVDHQQPNAWMTSSAVSKGIIGPCPLIRVLDMKGFDPDNRFGSASRTEQFLGSSQYIFGC